VEPVLPGLIMIALRGPPRVAAKTTWPLSPRKVNTPTIDAEADPTSLARVRRSTDPIPIRPRSLAPESGGGSVRAMIRRAALLLTYLAGCVPHPQAKTSAPTPSANVKGIALPGAPADGVVMDFLVYDRARHRVWVPAGNTGSVDVIDAATARVTRIEGFPTKEVERNGNKRTVGPSSASVGNGVVYIGDRADFSICAVDGESMKKGACLALDSSPDAVGWVAATKEVWVTTPRDRSIRVLDAARPGTLTAKTKISLPGEPECYAVDDARGVFFTNLEDADKTVAIDLKARSVVSTWEPACGAGGPKGLALDRGADVLFVACPDHVVALDAANGGRRLASIDVGPGVDSIDYDESRHELFAAAATAAKLVIAKFDPPGTLAVVLTVPTPAGARNAIAGDDGVAWLTDSREGKVLSVTR